ncbi:glycosyltransferase [Pseudoxanthomonas koreensis]|uniref:glycosyltransferase n=1 Tax=Pseudoxanthomonas koreensis TaxID=266061 RepID=UPI0035A64797
MSQPTTDTRDPTPLLSIVVLVYNTAPYLRECFDSLLGQHYGNIEVIAIDDASTDDSLAICRQYEAAHPNFRCITKPNEGGAVSGNLGISLARGEYVALVDSDDMVTADGYRLLMQEALRTGADISMGRAARLQEDGISSVSFLYEPYVWARPRVLDSAEEFPDLHHDGFYWNKVFRTGFLREHGLGMEPGLLYADRPFVHRAYWLSRRTAIIPQLVYLWRDRPASDGGSITRNLRQSANFLDRMRSARLEWEMLAQMPAAHAYRQRIALANLQRALHAASGIVGSPSFRQVFMPALRGLLDLYGDLDCRPLGPRRRLYLELVRRDETEGLCFLLGITHERGWVAEIEGACYWKQPFLDNAEVPIPREAMRLYFPVIGFFQLRDIRLEARRLSLTLHLRAAIMAGGEVDFELHSIYGEDTKVLVREGLIGEDDYGYALDMTDLAWEPGALYGLVMHFRTHDGIHGRYRISQAMVSPDLPPRLPLSCPHGQLLYSPKAGGMGFLAR